MKVVLQKDVKNVGKVGDLVSVKSGFARNFLFPRKLAVEATENRVKSWEHIKKVAAAKQKKALVERKELLEKLSGLTVTFKVVAGEKDKLFGAVTAHDISQALEKQGYMVDRRDIHTEIIKELGQHKAQVKFGDGLSAEITLSVERAES
jgi:large subunit ribosomal protein L9